MTQAVNVTNIQIQEIAGSPKEYYELNCFRAERMFVVPWGQREHFAKHFFGNSLYTCSSINSQVVVVPNSVESVNEGERLCYPGKTNVHVTKIIFEPYDIETIDVSSVVTPSSTLGNYRSYAKATVYYDSQSSTSDREDLPVVSGGTHITYKMISCVESIPLSSGGFFWQDDYSLPVSEDLNIVMRVPVTEHHLTWSNVVNPPWNAISSQQGKVNSTAFLGCPPETLLFEGAEANKIYNGTLQEGSADYTWKIRYIFREKQIKSDTTTYGWNHFWRSVPSGWTRLTSGTGFIYSPANFSTLFQSENSL